MKEFEKINEYLEIPETELYKELKEKLEKGEITEEYMLKELSGKYIAKE